MRIVRIALNGFRNYEWETVELAPGTNVISGQNAQGKTNLLESVYMLSTGRSFRTRFDKELVGVGFSGLLLQGFLLHAVFHNLAIQNVIIIIDFFRFQIFFVNLMFLDCFAEHCGNFHNFHFVFRFLFFFKLNL